MSIAPRPGSAGEEPAGQHETGGLPSPPAAAVVAAGVQWTRVEEILDWVKGTWALPVLCHLALETDLRPADLLAAINGDPGPGISRKMLFDTLARLKAHKLVDSRQEPGFPPLAYYWLTRLGHQVLTSVSRLGEPDAPSTEVTIAVPGVDATRPNTARMWNYFLGGKDNFTADRAAATAVLDAMPSLAVAARLVRQFQADAVRRLAGLGVRQFLDIGTGLPVAGAVHEVAQRIAPEARVVYVDNDPAVVIHAKALLRSDPAGTCDVLHADVRDPEEILAGAARTLDLDQPVAILLLAVLHFIADDDDPWGIVGRLAGGLRGAGYLVISHAATEHGTGQQAGREYNARSSVHVRLRPQEEVSRFFSAAGMTLTDGVMPLARWWPGQSADLAEVNGHVGIGRREAAARPAWARAG